MMTTERSSLTLLRQIPIFQGLDAAGLQLILQHSRRRKYPANEALFHEGDPGYTLFVIVSGVVSIQKVTSNGETVHLASRGPGEAFGELAIIDGKPRMADAVTAVPTELLMLDRDAFVQCIQTSPQIAFAVMSYLADRIREAGVQMESRQVLDVRGRLAERLLELAAASGREGADGEVRITARVTQQDLAEQIGTTRETINRELARMKAVQAIRMEGRSIILTNRKKLTQYSRK
ncbi:MAG TPA: Crp/Fnr family transcriptional regulator [Chthonomonadaceae bacterium]|nr:Crp/Fnr family transcriptional regulator [Chthonomonadaceae bacterium]